MRRLALSALFATACTVDEAPPASGGAGSSTSGALSTSDTSGSSAHSSDGGRDDADAGGETAPGSGDATTSDSGDVDPTGPVGTSTTRGDVDGGASESSTGAPVDPFIVQFVGNSYTAGNSLGSMVESIASEAGIAVEARVISPGGETLEGHWSTPSTLGAITDPEVDAVVLQGQSVEPWLGNASFVEHGGLLGNAACEAGAAVFFFETWARQAGHEIYDIDPLVPDPDAMQAILRAAYEEAAAASCAAVAPVGDAWQRVWTTAPQISLYAGDGSHRTLPGSYLAACVFAESVLGIDVNGAWAPADLNAADIAPLQAAAHCIVAGDCPPA
ncbi:MAG: hypothetical protein AAGA54_04100 [Myxococcota bacterium]